MSDSQRTTDPVPDISADLVATQAKGGGDPVTKSDSGPAALVAVANQKGGVGKTTTVVNLGAALAELDKKVLVIDLDPQGNATTGLGVDPHKAPATIYEVLCEGSSLSEAIVQSETRGLDVVVSTIQLAGAEVELVSAISRESKLKKAVDSVRGYYDYILIDCPPSLGLLTVNALSAADEILIPIQCEYYALEGVSQLLQNVQLIKSNLNTDLHIGGVVLTMYDGRTRLSDQVATEVRRHFGDSVFATVVPRSVRLSEAPSFGQPVTAFDPSSRGAIAYKHLAEEVIQRHG